MANTNKYWENEEPIETTTDCMEFRYFPEAGKFQMYGHYEVDGESRRTKAIVLDTGDITMSEATAITKAILEGLFDVSIGDKVMGDIISTVTSQPARDEEVSEEELGEALDEEFEDEVISIDYSSMSFKDLKAECDKRGISYKKIGESKANLINLLETYDDEHDDTSALADEKPTSAYDSMSLKELKAECKARGIKVSGKPSKDWLVDSLREDDKTKAQTNQGRTSDDDDGNYDGKWLSFVGGEVVAAPQRRKVDKATAEEWLDYFNICVGEVAAMVKKVTNKKANTVDIVKLKKLMDKWVVAFEADEDTTSMLTNFVEHFFSDIKADKPVQLVPERARELCMIIDQM